MSSVEMASKKKKKGPGSKKPEMDVEISRTSVSRKERIAAAKLPPGMMAGPMSPRAEPASPHIQRKNSIATLGGAASVPTAGGVSASGRRMSTMAPGPNDKTVSNKGGSHKDKQAQASSEAQNSEERARVAERKRNGKAFLDELIKTSTLNRNNEDAIIETSKKTFSNFDDVIRKKNLTMAILGSIVMLLVVVTLEYPWDEERAFYDRSLASMHAVEVLCSVITAYLMYLVYDYYNLLVDLDRLKYRQKYRTPLWKTSFFFPFLLELVVCFLHPVPWSDQRKMGMLAFMKLYLWVRVYRDYSAVYRWRQDAIDACDVSHGIPQFTSWLSVRTLFYKWPWHFVGVSVGLSLVLLSFMIYVVERETINESCIADPCNCPAISGSLTCANGFTKLIDPADIDPLRSCCHSPFKKLAVCLYYTAVTMTTVGYGDYATLSSWGRGISMWAAITGVCLSALLVTALLSAFSLTFSQKFAADFVLIKQLTISERDLAARVIQLWFRRLSINKGHYREGESRGLVLRMSASGDAQRSHLPSAWTNVPGRGCFGETYDEALMWAIKNFRQHRMLKEQTLTMDSEGGNGLYKTIVQVTRAYELMTQKVVDVELAQRRMQIILRKLVLLFTRLPQSLDPTALLPLGLGASMIDQLNKRDGAGFGGNGGQPSGSFIRSESGLGSGNISDSASDRDSMGGSAAAAQVNAEAQKRLQQLEQQLLAKSNQIQKLQQAESGLQRTIEDLNKRLQNSQDRTQKVIEAARKATSTQGPLRYRAISSVIKGLESVAVGGQLRSGLGDEDGTSEAGTTTAGAGTTSDAEESKMGSTTSNARTTQSPAVSRTSIVMPSSIANVIGGHPASILAIRTEAPTAEDLADPDGEWEEVVVPENALQEVAVVPVRPTLAPGVTRMTFGARNTTGMGAMLGADHDDEDEEEIDGAAFYPNMAQPGNQDRYY